MEPKKRYIRLPDEQRRVVSVVIGGYLILLVNSVLLLLFDGSTAGLYMSTVLLHVGLGLALVLPVVAFVWMHVARMPLRRNVRATAVGVTTAVSLSLLLVSGVGLVSLGSSFGGGWLLGLHVVTAVTSVLAFAAHVSLKRGLKYHFLELGEQWQAGRRRALRHPLTLTLAVGLGLSVLFVAVPWLGSRHAVVVQDAGGTVQPSSQAVLAHDGLLDAADLSRSETCGQAGCHPDVYEQWSESMHRFSSFNNPYYRRSIEYLVDRKDNATARWCASCHDPVMLYSGGFPEDRPLDLEHWTAKEGLTCLSCHAVEGLRDIKGNGRYVIAAPDEYPFARAEDGVRQWIHDRLVQAKPEPHRRAMLKPVHETAEFCGTCHKVGLPPDVNDYRWKRGQNEYDAWHASGVSGNTVRSFYLPDESKNCLTCHMPLVPSDDRGNEGGFIRSHRFAAANTAIPHLNGMETQGRLARENLERAATVDVFAVTVGGRTYGPGEAAPPLRPGDDVVVEVVVRNRGVGHGLPGGTNDSNELWVAVVGRDRDGEAVVHSGRIDAAGRVDSTAHFLGAVLVDRASRPINKRNAQDWIATVYANVITPGTAHTVRYRFTVPPGAPITELEAALMHRKFKWYFHNWTFRGRVAPGEPDSLANRLVDRRRWELDEAAEAPDIPVTTMAAAERTAGEAPEVRFPLWERWNDYGIGLLLQEDTRGALAAFEQVAALAPESPEGPINQARVLLAEGQLDRASEALNEAERRRPGYLKTAYFRGAYRKALGEYERALGDWMRVYEAYPQDRVLVLGIGRLHYLSGRFEEALTWYDRVLEIDPESVGGLYNRMLALGALGRDEAFAQAQVRYEYHKDDEDAQAVALAFKQRHPSANVELQPLHYHQLHPADGRATLALQPLPSHEAVTLRLGAPPISPTTDDPTP